MKLSKKTYHRLAMFSGVSCLVIAVLLILWSLLAKVAFFKDTYHLIVAKLTEIQDYIVHLDHKWMIVLAILFLFFLKTTIPIPFWVLLMAPGIAFPFYQAIIINLIGMAMLMALKYWYGTKRGGGFFRKLLSQIDEFADTMERGQSKRKTFVLFVFRLVPSFSINSISQLYGSMKYKFSTFIIVSLIGVLPRILSYAIAGRNVYDPFSFKFTIPLIFIFVFSGVSILSIDRILTKIKSSKSK
ncbi:MAG TPA: VTT domain-containing protein [Clostridiales bacterium]|nr:VTT domain-containing protein [Clostridiales bacterium]